MAILSIRASACSLALSTLLLAGCAGDRTRFPSLAKRPAERVFGTMTPVAQAQDAGQAPAAPASATVVARTGELTQRAAKAHQTFESQRVEAARLSASARGSAAGTESWSVAQIAMAKLDSARSEVMVAGSDLDRMLVDASVAGSDSDRAAIEAAQREVSGILADEDRVIADLRG